MKLKVCGMKYQENIEAVAALQPDYLGFIFYEKSPRNFDGEISKLPATIKKTGVFVDEPLNQVVLKIAKYGLKAIQLHGNESPEYCKALKEVELSLPIIENGIEVGFESYNFEVWKVFSIKDQFDFEILKPYEGIVDYFLFDTKGKEKGGNGYTFDWGVLNNYNSTTPFILSGGIGLNEIEKIKTILETDLPIYGIDINSKFEIEPGLKNINDLEKFKKLLTVDC
ncbi:phosphoribosylanthranilate isomerase [Aquimarina amphilecti]|uniref:N-(5'-phosphoribosyl)anthranilate isomerase n=1 Tax=Aquimarina amphilecti TaxID=1038014 RepID=A0A1H7SZS6_AQUAM|nr:phosphoribosylanthranilate isomerase [Aquimarina amphilecti]SEL78111.1 phosphoribosylanthranilate isomerase [Aquimarina amphilecti]